MHEPAPLTKGILGITVSVVTAPWRALRWFCRGLYRRRRALLYIVIALVAVHLIATLVTGIMLRNEIARLKSGGYLLARDQLIPHVPSGEKNAADIYQKAFDARRVSDEDAAKMADRTAGMTSGEAFDATRRVLADNVRYLALLREAARTSACAFPTNWDAGPGGVSFKQFAQLREGARMLQANSAVAAADGRTDAALADAATMLRIAEHAKLEPILIGQLVGYALQSMAVQSLRDALALGDPSLKAARDLMAQMVAIDEVEPSVRSMKGEIALLGLPFFEMARHASSNIVAQFSVGREGTNSWAGRALRAYGTVGRPLYNLDEIAYLRAMKDEVDAFSLPWPESHNRIVALDKRTTAFPTRGGILTSMLMPVFARAVWSREKTAANLGDAQIALALCIYKSERGTYPDSLSALEAAGFKLPNDPFGGQPFKYRREGAGFIVYSIGSDMKDDGGLPPVWDAAEKLSDEQRKYRKEHYDLPFTRPR